MANGIGDALRTAREEQGRTIEEASRATRVRGEYLTALEEERFEIIGGDVYAKGFLASYARYLSLDPVPLLETYRRTVQTSDPSPRLLERPVAIRARHGIPGWLVWIASGVILLFVAFGLANTLGGRTPSPAALPTEEPSSSATPTEPAPSESPSPSPTPTFTGVHLVILVEQECWIALRADGQAVFAPRTFTSGEAITADATGEMVLTLGNAGGVRLELNGRALGTPGSSGEVVRNGRCTPEGCDFVQPART